MGNQTVFDSGIPHGRFTGGVPEEKIQVIETMKLYNVRYFANAFKNDEMTCDSVLVPKAGHTFLHEVSVRGAKDLFKLCQIYGADWNKTDILGVTPLMKAAGCGQTYIVERLIANGADVSIKDPEGFTARDYARKFRQIDIEDLLIEQQSK